VLADEINRATPKTQSALLEAMQERQVTVGQDHPQARAPFFVLATQNPLEMEGTYPLPEAQLDRFLFKLDVDFPDHAALHTILDRTTGTCPSRARSSTRPASASCASWCAGVPLSRPSIQDYAVRVLQATHPDDPRPPQSKRYVRYGASPRGAQAIILAAKIRSLLEGRYAVAIDDIRAVAAPALRHRLILNFEGEAEGIRADAIIAEILASTRETA
jgi:MoxR-like ATPase